MRKSNEKQGMQTRVWGPAGWLFLHVIAQNYPVKPTKIQKQDFRRFFKSVGKVLPCSYCRQSYQGFLTEKDLHLTQKALASRRSLARWFYKLHKRVNKKLGKRTPAFKSIWKKYEKYRAKCSKSTDKANKKGCIIPQTGLRKKCKIVIQSCDKNGRKLCRKKRCRLLPAKNAFGDVVIRPYRRFIAPKKNKFGDVLIRPYRRFIAPKKKPKLQYNYRWLFNA